MRDEWEEIRLRLPKGLLLGAVTARREKYQ
jgi:hypothetical protein